MTSPSRPSRAAALVVSTAALAALGNLVLLRPLGAGVQVAAVVATATLAVLVAPFSGLAAAASEVGQRRLERDAAAEAGSAVKVAVVGAMLLALPLAAALVLASSSLLAGWLPMPTTSALFLVRAGLALPAVAATLVLGAGLLLVERPLVLLPAALVALAADLVMAWWWMARGVGGPGLELAGVGMGCTVGALLGAVTIGTVALSAARPRTVLALHRPTPFRVGDMGPLARAALQPALRATAAALALAVAWRWTAAACTDGEGMAALAGALALAVAAMALGNGALRWRGGRAAPVAAAGLMLGLGVLMLAAPAWVSGWVALPELLTVVAPTAVRLVGVGLVLEAAATAATVAGLLRIRLPAAAEVEWVLIPTVVVVAGLAALGRLEETTLALTLVVLRAASLPLLRRRR